MNNFFLSGFWVNFYVKTQEYEGGGGRQQLCSEKEKKLQLLLFVKHKRKEKKEKPKERKLQWRRPLHRASSRPSICTLQRSPTVGCSPFVVTSLPIVSLLTLSHLFPVPTSPEHHRGHGARREHPPRRRRRLTNFLLAASQSSRGNWIPRPVSLCYLMPISAPVGIGSSESQITVDLIRCVVVDPFVGA